MMVVDLRCVEVVVECVIAVTALDTDSGTSLCNVVSSSHHLNVLEPLHNVMCSFVSTGMPKGSF